MYSQKIFVSLLKLNFMTSFMTIQFLWFCAVVNFLCGLIASKLGEKKDMGEIVSFLLGFLFGIIGIIVVILSKDKKID